MRYIVYAILAALILVVPSLSRAEASGHGKGKPSRIALMKKKWGLTDEQADKLLAGLKARREAAKPLVDRLRLAQVQLRERVDGKASDKEIEAALSTVSSARKALRAQREEFQASLASILTPTQRAKMQLAMARRRELRRLALKRSRGVRGRRRR